MAIDRDTVVKGAMVLVLFVVVFLAFGNSILNAAEQALGLTQGQSGDTGSNPPTGVSTQYSKDVPNDDINKPRIPVNTDSFGKLSSAARTQAFDRIVLHHTGGSTASSAIETLKARGLSVHYVIGTEGTIYFLVDERREAFHCGCCPTNQETCCGKDTCFMCIGSSPLANNHNSIGIEIVNTGNAKDYYTEAQYTSLKSLLEDIQTRRGISIDNNHVFAHYQIGSGKWDPSPNFDWVKIGLEKPEFPASQTIPSSSGYS
jgi:N-acetyl-anhydromuramyl-L-alanine amidase AmpD